MKVTSNDLDAIAEQHKINQTQQTNFEKLLLNKTKEEMIYRISVIKDFRFKDTTHLIELLNCAVDECKRLLNE